jgi:L-aspartate oxidase
VEGLSWDPHRGESRGGVLKRPSQEVARKEVEAGNLLLLARLLLRLTLLRRESRGGHFREDFPGEGEEAYPLEARGQEVRPSPL